MTDRLTAAMLALHAEGSRLAASLGLEPPPVEDYRAAATELLETQDRYILPAGRAIAADAIARYFHS